MGVKYNREYQDILSDFSRAIAAISDCHELFEMSAEDWLELTDEEREEIIQTLADDLFYGLGSDKRMTIGSGVVEYDSKSHVIKVTAIPQVTQIVRLI